MKKRYTEAGATGPVPGEGGADPPVLAATADAPETDDAVFRDIVRKAAEGNIKYQELYLKYIDLISEKTADGDEVVYEATFIDDEDQDA
jgi:hypothetical protein